MNMERPNVGPTPGTEEYEEVKKKINAEGTQVSDDGAGEGALYIGTREEIDAARERAESGGRAPDLASYIRLHKHIVANPEAISQLPQNYSKYFNDIKPGKAGYNESNQTLLYKDAQGNVAEVQVNGNLIANISKWANNPYELKRLILQELESKGFDLRDYKDTYSGLYIVKEKIERERAAQAEQETKDGFNF